MLTGYNRHSQKRLAAVTSRNASLWTSCHRPHNRIPLSRFSSHDKPIVIALLVVSEWVNVSHFQLVSFTGADA